MTRGIDPALAGVISKWTWFGHQHVGVQRATLAC
jgi:hypothetical protein